MGERSHLPWRNEGYTGGTREKGACQLIERKEDRLAERVGFSSCRQASRSPRITYASVTISRLFEGNSDFYIANGNFDAASEPSYRRIT